MTTHVLHAGLPLCRFSTAAPRDWPEGDWWLSIEDYRHGLAGEDLCASCARVAGPRRHQRRRTRGYRTPAGVLYVGRPTIFGNPFVDWQHPRRKNERAVLLTDGVSILMHLDAGAGDCVEYFRRYVLGQLPQLRGKKRLTDRALEVRRRLPDLRGRDLACWCSPDQRCHADVLLELSNQTQEGPPCKPIK